MPVSRRLDFSEVPVIDVAALVDGDTTRLHDTVAALGRACSEVGFMYIRNHGVPRAALQAIVAESRRFFTLPFEQRMSVAVERSPQFRGYLPLKYKGEASSGDNLQEGFIVFHERKTTPERPMWGPNQWPAAAPGLRDAMLGYFAAVETLSTRLMRAFSMALGLAPDAFAPLYTEPMLMLKLNHYPAQDAPKHDREIGVVGHSDSGGFTILWQDDVGGLEIQGKTGEWVVVPPIADTYVINIGNIMQTWTNGRFSSTPHRVINRYGTDRYSIAFFVNPNYETVVRPLVGEAPADFEPFVSGDYQAGVYRRIYPQAT